MEDVKSWAFSICAAAICGGILNMILPEGSTQKIYKAVFCVFFLSVIIAPITEIKIPDFWEIEKSFEEAESFEENEFAQSTASIIEDKIISDTKELLTQKGIIPKDILVKVNILKDGSIDINKFVLTLSEQYSGLSEEIYQKTGVMPKILISGEAENGNN